MKIQNLVTLKKGKEASPKRFHPWIFSGAIQTVEGAPEDGDWVEVKAATGGTLGYGHYQKGTISVRLLTFSKEPPGDDVYTTKIHEALRLRNSANVISEFTNSFRLVNAEGDGLPGLIIDMYNGAAVVQAHSAGFHKDRHLVAEALRRVFPEGLKSVYYKSLSTSSEKAAHEYLLGMSGLPHIAMEHGNKFYVDWEEGQKTGFFLDQRENRKLLGEMSKGARVLNTFCYTGGFSVYALNGGARLVHSVDASGKAVELTRKNIELNGFDQELHQSFAMDTFDFLGGLADRSEGEENAYDVIILDPPAFAKHKDARHQAMKGYQRLNAEAMRVIKPGGIIFTFSCSQVVDRQLFYDTVVSSAIQAGREIKVLHHLSHPADHPVSIYHPEGEYLKGLVLYVN
jgi:23S rRNA (cytosine1962-C5)-methyltransferase